MGKTDKMEFTRVDAGPSISWGSEASTIAEDTSLLLGKATLELNKAVCLYKMSRELLDNANPSIDDLLKSELAAEMALEEDKVFIEGTGGTQPSGIFYNPRIRTTDLSGQVDQDNIREMFYQLRLGFIEPNGIVCHPRTAFDLGMLKDSNGRPIYGIGPGESAVTNVWGNPLRQTTKVAITNRPSANESYMIVGDWSQLLIGDKPGIRVETSADVYFTTDQIALRLVKHVGSLLRHSAAMGVIKGIQTSM